MKFLEAYIDSVAESMENGSQFEITHWDYKSIIWIAHDGGIPNTEL